MRNVFHFPAEQTLDGCFELLDAEVWETVGMFATYRDAIEYARTHQITRYEVWRDDELIESTEGTEV